MPAAIYAVGDVHGCLALLNLLHTHILADSTDTPGEKWIVYLGDYIDRGQDSAGVLDALLLPPPSGLRRIALAGNHEIMMLEFLERPTRNSTWLQNGGTETLSSYGLDVKRLLSVSERERGAYLSSHIPNEHVDFMRELPLTLSVPGMVFVHAGLRPGIAVDAQNENDLLWIRDDFLQAAPTEGRLVVHGHTPSAEPVVAPGRIGVDTGAFATGVLTAVKLTSTKPPQFITSTDAALPL
ncbi:MAG: metallophosphoesterase family protein [Devosia sp.]